MLSFCHEMLSLKNLVSAIVTCTWRDFVGRTRMRERYARKKTKRKPDANVIESRYNGTRSIDSRRIRNLIHANRPRIRINSFHRPSAGLNFDRLSRFLRLASAFTPEFLQRLPPCARSNSPMISRFPSLFRVICIRARGALIAQFPVTAFPVADDDNRVDE